MATTTITGDEATDLINQSQREIDMASRISELEPTNAPFIALLDRLGSMPAISPKVEWLEVVSMPRFDTVTASATSAASSLAIASATSGYYRVGDGIRVTETGEFVEVTGVSSTAIGVTRGIGGTTAASATSAALLYIVNNANAEGATLRTIKAVRLTNQYNYTQILRTPCGVSNTVVASSLYGQWSTERERLQYMAGKEHDRQREATFFWGARSENTGTAGSPKRYCGGLFEFISTLVTTSVGALTRSKWETFLTTGFRYGSDHKVFFASPLVMSALDGFIWNSAQTGSGNSSRVNHTTPAHDIGVAVQTYVCSQGMVDIVMKRHWADNANLNGMGFLVDMANVQRRPLVSPALSRDTKLYENRQDRSADKVEDEYLTEESITIKQEATHARLSGVTS